MLERNKFNKNANIRITGCNAGGMARYKNAKTPYIKTDGDVKYNW